MSDPAEAGLTGEEVAVVGMAGRFPGAASLEELWRNLRGGVESISFFSDEELRQAGVDAALLADPRYVRARGVLAGADLFDADCFGFSPREAAYTDPQQRIFLECAWEALEQAGIAPDAFAGQIGVYAGSNLSTYLLFDLAPRLAADDAASWQVVLANDKDTLATRVSYKLDLRGPSIAVQTACSTSLVAVHLARQSLLDYECDVALAGGVAIRSRQIAGYRYEEAGILSPDGHCRAFDAGARGTVFGSGAGVVVLKRLADALADGDTVRAVLRGSAVTNDGAQKAGFTAPSEAGQAAAIDRALAVAGVDPATVQYVEAHGSGTPVGDGIEIAALTRAFRAATAERGFCALGSVKTNLGHLDSAAGVAGLIKTVLALEHREIPASLHLERPSPQIDFAASPFYVNGRLRAWEAAGGPRRAGVSSFGIGGTNAHVVVEEAPALPETSAPARPWQLLVLSAKTPTALAAASGRLASYLAGHADTADEGRSFADAAFTLQVGRRALPWRRALLCRSREDALAGLGRPERQMDGAPPQVTPGAVFLFSGQASHRVDMGRELYLGEPLFRREVDRMCEILLPHLGGEDLRPILYPAAAERAAAAARLGRTAVTQPALFVVETALARLWMSWGVQPQAMIGHSLGEYVAAHLAGTLSLEDALALVAARGRLMEELPGGAMLAVQLAEAEVAPLLADARLAVAAVNAADRTVVAGPEDAVAALAGELASRGVESRRLATSHAFHSPAMDALAEPFLRQLAEVDLRPPEVPWISNVTGRPISDEEATDPAYWVRHMRSTVRFAAGLDVLLAETGHVFVELGPGALAGLVRRAAVRRGERRVAVSALAAEDGGSETTAEDGGSETAAVLAALARVWAAGVGVDWSGFHAGERRRRIPLPTYPFERRRFWVEPLPEDRPARPVLGKPAARAEAGREEAPASAAAVAEAGDAGAPSGPIAARIAEIWREVLGIGHLDLGDRFFDLGGDSLAALQVAARLREAFAVDLPLRALFELPTVAALSDAIATLSGAGGAAEPAIERRPGGGPAPLAFVQEQLWFLHRLEPASTAYNLCAQIRLSGRLDRRALGAALGGIVARHEILRTVFSVVDERPAQVVLPATAAALPWIDLGGLGPAAREAERLRSAGVAAARPFDLARGPLVRGALFIFAPEEHLLLLATHHIVYDGLSQSILMRELAALYGACAAGAPSPLPPLALQFADFAAWQQSAVGASLAADLDYWRRQLADAAPLDLVADRPRAPFEPPRGASRPLAALPAALAAAAAALARAEETTPFAVYLAAFQALLLRYTGQLDISVGTPVTGRRGRQLEALIGPFVNTVVVRGDLAGEPSLRTALGRLRATVLAAFDHPSLPFERLVEELRPDREGARNPLFQVAFAYHTTLVSELAEHGVVLRMDDLESRAAAFDLSLHLRERAGVVDGKLEFSAALFDRTTAERLAGHYRALLAAALASPDVPLWELPLLAAAERHQLVAEWNDTAADFPAGVPVHELALAQAARTPDAVAVAGMGEALSYGALARLSLQLAGRLADLGVGPEVRVGICVERSPALVVGVLAVLAAGGIYVPLEPTHPRERRRTILADSGARVLLTERLLLADQPEHQARLLLLDEEAKGWAQGAGREGAPAPPLPAIDPDNLAYVIYTSGSTGRPKGVEVRHRGVVAYLAAMAARPGLAAGDVVMALATLAFDISVTELLLPLTVGARAELMGADTARDGRRLAAALADLGATVLQVTPATWSLLVEAGWAGQPGLQGMCGGEALPRALAEKLRGRVGELWNVYGPTETTVWSALERVTPGGGAVALGRPAANMVYHLVGFRGELVPLGAVGELAIGGEGLGRGYQGRPDLTAERFVPDPLGAAGGRLYRTGDLARRRADGRFDYLGRVDHQVKVRGFRIELGEIEATLARHPAVRECVVTAREEEGEKALVAYLVAEPGAAPDVEELRAHLAAALPPYMVPAFFVSLLAFPLSPNGKVDRRALPAPERTARAAVAGAAPRDEEERLIAQIWSEVLGLAEVGIHDDFFAAGGHSLRAMQVVARIRDVLGVELPLRELFAGPSVAELARAARAARRTPLPPIAALPPSSRAGDLPLSFAQERLWLLDQIEPGSTAYNLPLALLVAGDLPVTALRRALAEVGRRHEALRTTFTSRRGAPVQRIAPPGEAPELPVVDLAALPPAVRQALGGRLAEIEARRPFDLARGPLSRVALLRLGPREHLLLATFHHIVSDGWSKAVLLRELTALLAAFSCGLGSPLPDLPLQYADYAVWQRSWLRGEVLDRQLAYWRRQLAGAPQVLELAADRPRTGSGPRPAGLRRVVVPAALVLPLQGLCRRLGVTPFMALCGAWAALLERHAGGEALLLGTPVAGRGRRELEDLIGLFVNLLALRVDLGRGLGFDDLLRQVRETALDGFAHQDLPFERLVEEVAKERELDRSPLVQVLFALHNEPLRPLEFPGLALRPLPPVVGAARFDLSLDLAERAGGIDGYLEYDAGLFDATTATRLAGRYVALLAAALDSPERAVWELPMLAAAERHQTLREWNDAAAALPSAPSVHGLVLAQAARTPEAVAVVADGAALSYGELARRSGRLARRLARLGVGPEERVGICAERSPRLVVGLLGVLRAGGAYVPLDPSHPGERLGMVLADCGAEVLLTERRLLAELPPHALRVILLDEEPEAEPERPGPAGEVPATEPEALAYVIYTSGSTGRPKGVEVRHRGVVNFLASMAERPGLAAGDVMLAVTTLAFDIAVAEIFLPLAVGARVELLSGEAAMDVRRLAAALAACGATAMQATPATWTLLVESGWTGVSGLKALCGGEALSGELAEALARRVGELWNLYGPTETTVWSALSRVAPGAGAQRPALGRPLANTTLHLLGAGEEPLPPGAIGELAIGGEGLARGYHGQPELTADRFVPDPFGAAGGRLYRTGDLARRRAGGTLDYLGRVDHQVKVRGFRIELGEVEAALARHAGVRECVVVARQEEGAAPRLVAYLVPAPEAAPETGELRAFLAVRLPSYMIPALFVPLDALPLSPNGKVDRGALPLPRGAREVSPQEAPRNAAERALAEIWRRALRVESVGIHDNFFERGGDSMLGARVVFLAQEAGLALTLRDLFRHQTLEELAAAARQAAQAAASGEPAAAEEAPPHAVAPLARPEFPAARLSARELDRLIGRIAGGKPAQKRSDRP